MFSRQKLHCIFTLFTLSFLPFPFPPLHFLFLFSLLPHLSFPSLFPPLLLFSLQERCKSHDESYDFERELVDRELEGSDHFPMSCASSVTIVSEHDQHTFTSPVTSGGESPVIRPHPFTYFIRCTSHIRRKNFFLCKCSYMFSRQKLHSAENKLFVIPTYITQDCLMYVFPFYTYMYGSPM